MKQAADAYGNPLETELGEVYDDEKVIIKSTKELSEHFKPNEFYGEPGGGEEENEPGFIPDLADFSNVVCFGISGDGAPFCFDFRDNVENPSVIWWADTYWRRVAPSYEAFIRLFDLSGDT